MYVCVCAFREIEREWKVEKGKGCFMGERGVGGGGGAEGGRKMYLREYFLSDPQTPRVRYDADRCDTAAWDGLAPQIDAHGEEEKYLHGLKEERVRGEE